MDLKYIISKILKKIQIPAVINSTVDKRAKICSASHVVGSTLGRYTYVGNNCTVVDTEIGSFCSIADNCIIGGASHPIDWVSTSPVFNDGKNILKQNFSKNKYSATKKTHIGNDVWIGNNALIKGGISIGNGAVIGMGSVVTKNVGEYEVWAGNPAKLIKKRFDDAQIDELLTIEWWTFSEETLNKNGDVFNDVEQFIAVNTRRSND